MIEEPVLSPELKESRLGLLRSSVEKYKKLKIIKCKNCFVLFWAARLHSSARCYCTDCQRLLRLKSYYAWVDRRMFYTIHTPSEDIDELSPIQDTLTEINMRVQGGGGPIQVVGEAPLVDGKISYERQQKQETLSNKCRFCRGFRNPIDYQKRCHCT